jgi:hypothetical protein
MKKLLIVLPVILLMSACATTTVSRVESGTQQDLSGYWNARDVIIVCEALIEDCLRDPEIRRITANRRPAVIVGRFRNTTGEHIDTEIISSTMESVLLRNRTFTFVAGDSLRRDLDAERQYQLQGNVSDETAARIGRETGADYMLTGEVRSIVDRQGNTTIRTYYVRAVLTDIETNTQVWIGHNSDITKVITRPRNRL